MNISQAETIKTVDQARQFAIDWQDWQLSQSLSYGDIIDWSSCFAGLGHKFGLYNEFKENGII